MSNGQFSAALLAGGRSVRMGCDKALLSFRGERLLDRQLTLLRSLGPAEIFLSCRPGTAYDVAEARIVFDEYPDAGPLGGIAACLSAMRTPRLVVLAVDMPCLRLSLLEKLVRLFPRGVVPRIADRYEPLAAVYPRDLLAAAMENLRKKENALHVWIDQAVETRQLEIYRPEGDEESLFANWNEGPAPGTLPTVP